MSKVGSPPTAGSPRPPRRAATADVLAWGQLAAVVILILLRWLIITTGLTHTSGQVKNWSALRTNRVCCESFSDSGLPLLTSGSETFENGQRVASPPASAEHRRCSRCTSAVDRARWGGGESALRCLSPQWFIRASPGTWRIVLLNISRAVIELNWLHPAGSWAGIWMWMAERGWPSG